MDWLDEQGHSDLKLICKGRAEKYKNKYIWIL